jgi:hypothetical protein
MKQSPVFNIEKTEGNNYTFTLGAVQILGKPDSTSSNAITPLRLTGWGVQPMHNSSDYIGINISAFNLTIATKYPDAWTAYFNETAQENGFENGTDYTVRCMPESGHVRFSFLGNGSKKLEWLYISKAKIGAELGAGSSFNATYRTGWGENIMWLNKWYCFETVSGTDVDLSLLKDYDLGSNFLTQSTGAELSGYSGRNEYEHKLNNQLSSTFGFSSLTEFKSQPSSATILMIYQPDLKSNPLDMTFAGNKLNTTLNKGNGNNWYLYTQTIPATSINDPSDLEFYLNMNSQGGKYSIHIDYLAVSLS